MGRIELTGLRGSSKSLFLSYLYATLSRPLLVLTSDSEKAETIRDDLEGFIGQQSVRYYPARGVLPFEERSASVEVTGLRVETLADLTAGRPITVVAPVRSILEKVVPPEVLASKTISLRVGQTLDFDRLAARLIELDFQREPIVEEVGQFSLRGGIVDLYPFGSENPLRLEFFGDTIESIRSFDISTQRSIAPQQGATILPCTDGWEQSGGASTGEAACTLLRYLTPEAILFIEEPSLVRDEAQKIIEEIEAQYLRSQQGWAQVDSSHFVSHFEEIEDQLGSYPVLTHSLLPEKGGEVIDLGARGQEPFNGNFNLLREGLVRLLEADYHPFIVCDNRIQAERLEELADDLSGSIRFAVGHLHHGFLLPDAELAVYTDHEVFRRHRLPHRPPKYGGGVPLKDFETLRRGDYVVHIDHGIGRFEGLKRIAAGGTERDCLSITYQNSDRLFVPIDQLHRVQKYVGAEGAVPTLSKLGSTQWERTKERTRKAITNMAADLIKIDAVRKAQKGHAFSPDTEWQKAVEAAFPYEETPDQLKAADEVKQDMECPAPMDRLVCGDVGYGKTEVVVRAAFKAVMDGKQVAFLVPTTILAQQHFKTFLDRLGDYPIRVEMLSRFRTRSEQREIIEGLKKGTVDIVIGTHRLLQKDVGFKDLGLVVVDEEQRFGVTHKERLKKLRTLVDVLTLTATPIPR
ncbi:MAG: DEAD/DEAH box helicase, partial [bacterium]